MDVVVIGGGPAGVATAASLGARGIGAVVLESGARAFAGLATADPDMRFLSPARLSRLPGMTELDGADTYVRLGDWIDRAERYRARTRVDVRTNARVTSVRRAGDRLIVEGIAARHVVDASGQLGWPRVPDGVADTELPWKLARDVRADDLARATSLVIVGSGVSAAETLASWLRVRPRGAHAWIARRRPRPSIPRHPFGIDVHYWIWPFEQLPWPSGRRPPEPLVLGTTLPRAHLRPSVRFVGAPRFTRHAVIAGDTVLAPDLIVCATGYRHPAPHLGDLVDRHDDGTPRVDACRSLRDPRVWVIGAPGARSAASSFLRGIAADAEHVAAEIAKDLR